MNKTVLITGASSGIGLEFSKIFARNGYNIVMVSQNEINLEKAKYIVSKENPKVEILTISKDLSKFSAPEEIFKFTNENEIKVDILVNNAGVQVYGNFHETNIERLEEMMYINMFALAKLTRLFVEGMVKRGEGKILNVASTGAFQPCPLNSAYCGTKAFVLYLSEGISEELKGTGVTVTALCPGATKTNFAKRANIEDIKLFKGNTLNADKVAEIGYNALMKGRPLVVTGLYNKVLASSVRFIPRSMVVKVGMNMMKK
ncbi:MAG: SDR family NAD(P)-dependent oxidoreductase [Clostridiaceae bacterium]